MSELPSGASAIVWAPRARTSAPSYSGRAGDEHDRRGARNDGEEVGQHRLTDPSTQCASSMTNSTGSLRASDVVLMSAVSRRRRASGSIWGSGISGSAMPSRSSSSSRSCGSASANCAPARRTSSRLARSSWAAAWKGTSCACDSQKAQNTSTPRPAASEAASRANRLLPMPGDPTTFITAPRPAIARSMMASRAAISQRRPIRLPRCARPRHSTPIATSRRARTGSPAPLMRTHSGSASVAVCSTSRAVDSDSITPPGGATDSIRWANPTVSPVAV